MKLPNDYSKYLSNWKYTEYAKYVSSLDKVIRIKKNDSILFDIQDIESFRIDNNNVGLYTSVWQYNSTDLESATRLGPL